jgi:hypothetical protein
VNGSDECELGILEDFSVSDTWVSDLEEAGIEEDNCTTKSCNDIPFGKLLVFHLLPDAGGAYKPVIFTPLTREFTIALL